MLPPPPSPGSKPTKRKRGLSDMAPPPPLAWWTSLGVKATLFMLGPEYNLVHCLERPRRVGELLLTVSSGADLRVCVSERRERDIVKALSEPEYFDKVPVCAARLGR